MNICVKKNPAMCLASSRESQEGSMAEMEQTRRRKKGSKGANDAGFLSHIFSLAALGLSCCMRAFSSCTEQGATLCCGA